MQLKGISPLLTPEVLAGLAHLQLGQLIAVVGEGFPRLPRRLWGQSPWPMYFPQEVIADDVGVRGILDGLLEHVPVDAFYWSTDHDREVPGYLAQVRWQVRSSAGRGVAVPDHGVPSDQLLEMVRTAQLLVRTCEVRCNSPIVLRVGTVGSPREPRRGRRARAFVRPKKNGKTRAGSSSSSEEEVKAAPVVAKGGGEPEADEVDAALVVKKALDKKADVGVQTTPRLARRADLSLSVASVDHPADDSPTPTNSPVPSPLSREPPASLWAHESDESPKTDVCKSTGLRHEADVPAGSRAPGGAQRPPPHAEASPTPEATSASPSEDVCEIVFARRAEPAGSAGPRTGRAVFARRSPPELPSSPPPPTPPTSPYWLGSGEELLKLQSVAIVQAAARQLRGDDHQDTPTHAAPGQVSSGESQEGEQRSPPEDAQALPEAPLSSGEVSTIPADASPLPSVRKSIQVQSEKPLFHVGGNEADVSQHRDITAPPTLDPPVQESPCSEPTPLTPSIPRARLCQRPLVSVLKKPEASTTPARKLRKRVSFDENLVQEVAAPEQEQEVAAPEHEREGPKCEVERPLVRITSWAMRDQPDHSRQADAEDEAEAEARRSQGQQRPRKPWVRSSKPGLRLPVPDIIPVNTMTLAGPARPRTRKLSDSFKNPYRSVPLCLPSPALDM